MLYNEKCRIHSIEKMFVTRIRARSQKQLLFLKISHIKLNKNHTCL